MITLLLAAAAFAGMEVVGTAPDTDTATAHLGYGRRVALVVGIGHYQEPSLDLDYALRDAEGVAALLGEQYRFDEVITLADADAAHDDVLATLDDLARLEAADALVIFWAGHGITAIQPDGSEQGYLLPWDGSRSQPDHPSNLSMTELRQRIERDIPARHKLLIVDACYSGLLAVRDAPVEIDADLSYLQAVLDKPAFQILTAGQADQTVLDEGPGGHSVFTGTLLTLLEETDDFITATELALAAQRQVQAAAFSRSGHQQRPDFGRISGTGDFVFIPGDTTLRLTPPTPLLGTPARKLAAASTAAALIGVGGLTVAGITQARYQQLDLSDGPSAALYTANRASYAAGLGGLGLGSALLTAAIIQGEW